MWQNFRDTRVGPPPRAQEEAESEEKVGESDDSEGFGLHHENDFGGACFACRMLAHRNVTNMLAPGMLFMLHSVLLGDTAALGGGRYDLSTVCSILCSLKLGYGHPSESHHDRLQIHVAHPQICRSFLDDTEDLTHVALTRLWKICEAVQAPEACLCGDIRDHFVTYSSTFCLCLLSKKWLPTNYHSTTVCLECNIGLCAHCFDPFYDNQ